MTRTGFREQLGHLLERPVDNLGWEEKVELTRKTLIEFEKAQRYDQSNVGKSWSDEELRLVRSLAPSRENTIRLARAFKRSYGSVEQIFRWAGQSERRIREERRDNAFIQQIRRIRKELGWRSVGGDQ